MCYASVLETVGLSLSLSLGTCVSAAYLLFDYGRGLLCLVLPQAAAAQQNWGLGMAMNSVGSINRSCNVQALHAQPRLFYFAQLSITVVLVIGAPLTHTCTPFLLFNLASHILSARSHASS